LNTCELIITAKFIPPGLIQLICHFLLSSICQKDHGYLDQLKSNYLEICESFFTYYLNLIKLTIAIIFQIKSGCFKGTILIKSTNSP